MVAIHVVEATIEQKTMNVINIGTPMKAPASPHMKLQKNTEKMTAKGDMASDAPASLGSR